MNDNILKTECPFCPDGKVLFDVEKVGLEYNSSKPFIHVYIPDDPDEIKKGYEVKISRKCDICDKDVTLYIEHSEFMPN